MPTVGTARSAAQSWIKEYARSLPTYGGCFVAGSTVDLPATATLPPTSDIDLTVITAPGTTAPGKLRHDGILLDVSHLPWSEIGTAEQVLASYPLAPSFRTDTILDDPTGRLRPLQAAVAAGFAEPRWITARRDHTFARIERNLRGPDGGGYPERVLAWLFAIGVTCHSVLVAARRNPTVRLRYPAARKVLDPADYERLVRLLVPGELSAERVRVHLDGLEAVFDAVASRGRAAYPFGSDLRPEARTVAIDGSRALVEAGLHREAMFWIVATYARCHTVLADVGPAFEAAVADLDGTDLDPHRVQVYLPELRELTDRIIADGSA
jgi:hypothetical protein